MAHNREALALRALKELRLVGEGQSASASEMADAVGAIPPLLDRLRYLHVYSASNSFSFADAVFYPLAVLLAEDLAPSLAGRPKNEFLIDKHMSQLRRIQKQPLVRNELRVELALQNIRDGVSRWL